ncbi:hypothetical protein FOA43_003581 [Brettanomyces nanus]|uniref:Transcriptional regulatory protein RXT2 N-terminal domain-containing protein n=1 Tax=Eeniella nana TaxID=13502 RepID=A0A875S7C6_EENNA|nr:uncharacterized protein FOA43_003581 [Brettanomyces nanus]QPG76195.1 hypothetical protein FOA43_003581 [Brettanomyces nanus]
MSTKNSTATLRSLKGDILRFRHSVESRKKDGPEFNEAPLLEQEDEEFSSGGSNRGNKFLYNSDTVDCGKLNSSRDNFKLVTMNSVDQTTGKHTTKLVLQDKRMSLDELVKMELDEEYGSVSDDEDNDYYGADARKVLESIDLADILGPITSPSDVVNRKSISTIYKSQHLSALAEETIHIIEKEQDNVNQLSQLLAVFLGDDSSNIYADLLKLPNYDHHLDLGEEMNNADEHDNVSHDESALKNGEAGKDEDTIQDDDDITNQQPNGSLHMVSNEASNKLIKDPFFKLPQYRRDFNFGVHKTENAEETRQLVQIALQRNEEFIRSLCSIRMGFIKAERLKDSIYGWCKEMGEDARREQ